MEQDGAVCQAECVHRNAANGRKCWEEEISGMHVHVCVLLFVSSPASLTLTDTPKPASCNVQSLLLPDRPDLLFRYGKKKC